MNIGEEAISPQTQRKVAPDMVSEDGKAQVTSKLAGAIGEKEKLDYILKGIADHSGATFESRVKNPDTVVKKIVQKRLEGRDYKLDDINDAYGGRFIANEKSHPQIKEMLQKASSLGLFNIHKAEDVRKGNYHAFHYDIETPRGTKGEIQLMTHQEELESVANHSLRAEHGEKASPPIEKLKDKQSKISYSLPAQAAHQKAQQIQAVAKTNDGKPLDPRMIASILNQKIMG